MESTWKTCVVNFRWVYSELNWTIALTIAMCSVIPMFNSLYSSVRYIISSTRFSIFTNIISRMIATTEPLIAGWLKTFVILNETCTGCLRTDVRTFWKRNSNVTHDKWEKTAEFDSLARSHHADTYRSQISEITYDLWRFWRFAVEIGGSGIDTKIGPKSFILGQFFKENRTVFSNLSFALRQVWSDIRF